MMLLDKTIVHSENNMGFLDIFMLGLFIAFMFFIFGGYHKEKYKKRQNDTKEEEK